MNNHNTIYNIMNDVTFTLILFLIILVGTNNILIENADYKKENKEEKTIVLIVKNNKIIIDKEYTIQEFENEFLLKKSDKLNIILKCEPNITYQYFFTIISILNRYGIEKIGIEKSK